MYLTSSEANSYVMFVNITTLKYTFIVVYTNLVYN